MLASSAQVLSDDASGTARKARGLSSVDLAARLRLFTRGSQVFSLEPHVILPGTVDEPGQCAPRLEQDGLSSSVRFTA